MNSSNECETKWNKKMKHKNMNLFDSSDTSALDTSTNYAPYGEILWNLTKIKNSKSTELENKIQIEGFKEGAEFNMFEDSKKYYENCKRLLTVDLPIKQIVQIMIDILLCPFYEVDTAFENLIKFLLTLFQKKKTETGGSGGKGPGTTDWNYQWTNKEKPVFENFIEALTPIKPATTKPATTKPATTPVRKILSMFLKTYGNVIDSMYYRHPWLQTYELYDHLVEYYAEQLKKKSANTDIVVFNDTIDAKLANAVEDTAIYSEIKEIFNKADKYLIFPELKPKPPSKNYGIIIPSSTTPAPATKRPRNDDDDIRDDAMYMKDFVYKILLIPIYFFVAYNFYYVTCFCTFKESDVKDNGKEKILTKLTCERKNLLNIEEYFKTFRDYTCFFTEFIFKPTKLLWWGLDIVKDIFLYLNNQFPYIVFMIFILISWGIISNHLQGFFDLLKQMYQLNLSDGIYYYCLGVTAISFLISTGKQIIKTFMPPDTDDKKYKNEKGETNWGKISVDFVKWVSSLTLFGLISKTLYLIIYITIRATIVFGFVTLSGFIFILYLLYICFGSFHFDMNVMNYMNQAIYSNIYKKSDENIFMKNIKKTFGALFTYFFEITTFFILYNNTNKDATKSIKGSPNVKAVCWIIYSLFYFLLFLLMGYRISKNDLQKEYSLYNNEKVEDILGLEGNKGLKEKLKGTSHKELLSDLYQDKPKEKHQEKIHILQLKSLAFAYSKDKNIDIDDFISKHNDKISLYKYLEENMFFNESVNKETRRVIPPEEECPESEVHKLMNEAGTYMKKGLVNGYNNMFSKKGGEGGEEEEGEEGEEGGQEPWWQWNTNDDEEEEQSTGEPKKGWW